jgi:tripartite-type tricarboxylate transporter receptor subunit TctC
MRKVLTLAAVVLAALLARQAQAQTFPTRSVLIVVPFAAGGSNDIIARVIGERLQKAWGQSVVVENQAGAAGSIGVARVAKADPDGHTLAVISITFTINAVLQTKQPFDPVGSFAPVALLGRSPMVLAVAPKHQTVSTPAALVALARSLGDKPLTYGTAGNGSINHIGAELLRQAAGMNLAHVPYRGVPLALNDMIGGHVDLIVASLPPMLEQIRAGKVKGIAVTSKKRAEVIAELPTLDETIAPGYELYQWWGVLAPAGTSPAVVTTLNAAINKELASSDVRAIMAREGAEVTPEAPEALAALIRSDISRWQKLAGDGRLQPSGERK